jgi:hypothetical protein
MIARAGCFMFAVAGHVCAGQTCRELGGYFLPMVIWREEVQT